MREMCPKRFFPTPLPFVFAIAMELPLLIFRVPRRNATGQRPAAGHTDGCGKGEIMNRTKRHHTPEFKALVALEVLRSERPIADIAASHDIHPSLAHAWKQQLAAFAGEVFLPDAQVPVRAESAAMRELKKRIEKIETEQEWLQRVVSQMGLRERRDAMEPDNDKLSILRQTRLLGLHRSGVYYHRRPDAAEAGDVGASAVSGRAV